jgi:hypothetical protein
METYSVVQNSAKRPGGQGRQYITAKRIKNTRHKFIEQRAVHVCLDGFYGVQPEGKNNRGYETPELPKALVLSHSWVDQ